MTGSAGGPSIPQGVLFDVGGVFVVPDPGRCRDALLAAGFDAAGVLEDDWFVAAHFAGVAALDGGGPTDRWGRYDAGYLGHLGWRAGEPGWGVVRGLVAGTTAAELWCHPIAEAVAALRRLATAGVPVAIVSNSDGTVEQKLADLGICQVGPGPGVEVAVVVDSGAVGVAKPDPAIFTPALDALGLDASRCWYVGDTVTFDVVGARRAGLWPVLHDPLGIDRPGLDGATRVASVSALANLVLLGGPSAP